MIRVAAVTALLGFSAASQAPPPPEPPNPESEPDVKLPNGKSQREEILKAEHKKSLEDIVRIQKLAGNAETISRRTTTGCSPSLP